MFKLSKDMKNRIAEEKKMRLTKRSDLAYEWSEFSMEYGTMDPEGLEDLKLEFIGICEEFCGLTSSNVSQILVNSAYHPFSFWLKRHLLGLLIK